MNSSIWTLVCYEYIKIFKRKATYYALAMVLLFAVVSAILGSIVTVTSDDGLSKVSGYELMKIDRGHDRALKGDIDEALIEKVLTQYQIAWSNPDNLVHQQVAVYNQDNFEDVQVVEGSLVLSNKAYDKYCRPYEKILNMINTIYASPGGIYDEKIMSTLTPEAAKDFYAKREAIVNANLTAMDLTDAEFAKHKARIESQRQS